MEASVDELLFTAQTAEQHWVPGSMFAVRTATYSNSKSVPKPHPLLLRKKKRPVLG